MRQRFSLLAFLLVIDSPLLQAATDHAGRVTLGGVPVPGARVTATQGDQRVAGSTNQEGIYRFPALTEGIWSMRVEMLGFSPLTRDVMVGPGGSPTTWELTVMPFAEITRGIPPPPPAPPVQPARRASPPPRTSEARPPNQPDRSAAPVVPPPGAGAPARPGLPGGPGAAAVAPPGRPAGGFGDDPASNPNASGDSLLVNGSVNSGAFQPPSLGNVRRPTGIRLYNGTIALNGGNSAFDASPYSITGRPQPKPDTSNLSVTGTFGGPIRIPRLMRNPRNLQLNYSRTSNNNANSLSEPMPTLLQRNGDFSQTVDGFGRAVQIIDPQTGLPFEGNIVPADRISPQAAALLRYYPRPDPLSDGASNYQIATLSKQQSDTFNGSMPNLLSTTTNQLGFNAGYNRSTNESTSLFGFDSSNHGAGFNSSVNWTHRFVPSNQQIRFRHTYNRRTNTAEPFFSNRTNVSGEAGITGNNQEPVNWGPPSLSFASGIAGLSDSQYSFNRTQAHGFNAESFKSRGRHSMTFGGNVRYQQLDIVSQQNARGGFTFSGAQTGYDFADFLLGIPNTSSIAYGNADKGFRAWNYDAYITDDFRVKPNFTVQVGVRWEYEAPVTEHLGRLVNLDLSDDFSAAAPVIADDRIGPITGRRYPKSLIEPDPFGIQPRVGIAWRPVVTSSIIVRAGYGMYRNTSIYQSMATLMAQQPPLSFAFNAVNTPETPLTLANGFVAPTSTTLNTVAIDPDFRVGLVHRWQVSIQRDLPAALTITGTYLGGKGRNLPQSFLPNTYPEGVDTPCPLCPSGFVYTTSHGTLIQNAAQVQLRRRLRSGLTWMAGYTLSKATDNASSFSSATGGGQGIAQNWLDLEAERGPSSFDQRHQVTAQTTYTTGQGVSGGSMLTGLKGALVKGWTITMNLTGGSGTPRTPTYRFTSVAGVTGTVRGDVTGEPIDASTEGYYVNPAAFAPPAFGSWGTAGRNSIRGPKQFSLNGSITRNFPLRNRLSLDWQVDARNILNQVTYSSIDTMVGSTQFGLPTATNAMRTLTTNLRLRF